MAQFKDCKFHGTTVVLDGHEYLRCEFSESKIVLTRGNFSLRDCSFDICEFEFGGEAANIKALVVGLMHQSSGKTEPTDSGAKNHG
jgi:hypothetical protein